MAEAKRSIAVRLFLSVYLKQKRTFLVCAWVKSDKKKSEEKKKTAADSHDEKQKLESLPIISFYLKGILIKIFV